MEKLGARSPSFGVWSVCAHAKQPNKSTTSRMPEYPIDRLMPVRLFPDAMRPPLSADDLKFPIRTSVWRIVRLSCPRHNQGSDGQLPRNASIGEAKFLVISDYAT